MKMIARQLAPTPSDDESSLVTRIRDGDARAFEIVFRQYHAPLCDYADRFVRSPAETEDLVHDLFAWIWERRATWFVKGNLRTYLFTSARNRALNALKRATVEERWRAAQAATERVASNGAEEHLASEAAEAALDRVLSRLPARCRMAVTLRWRRQLSYVEIAVAMGISTKTVEIYVAQGRKALSEAYSGH